VIGLGESIVTVGAGAELSSARRRPELVSAPWRRPHTARTDRSASDRLRRRDHLGGLIHEYELAA